MSKKFATGQKTLVVLDFCPFRQVSAPVAGAKSFSCKIGTGTGDEIEAFGSLEMGM